MGRREYPREFSRKLEYIPENWEFIKFVCYFYKTIGYFLMLGGNFKGEG